MFRIPYKCIFYTVKISLITSTFLFLVLLVFFFIIILFYFFRYFLHLHFKYYPFPSFLSKTPYSLLSPPAPQPTHTHTPTQAQAIPQKGANKIKKINGVYTPILGHRIFTRSWGSPPIDDQLCNPLLHMQLETLVHHVFSLIGGLVPGSSRGTG